MIIFSKSLKTTYDHDFNVLRIMPVVFILEPCGECIDPQAHKGRRRQIYCGPRQSGGENVNGQWPPPKGKRARAHFVCLRN